MQNKLYWGNMPSIRRFPNGFIS